MELEGAKKTAEQVIGDVKAIKGIFDWFIGLFVSKPAADAPKPVAKAKAAAKQQSYEELELKLINDVGEQLGNFFDIQQQLQNYYLELEETSKTNYDPAQNTSKKAIERALVELQLEKLGEQIREQMTTYAPAELKAIYSRFLKMYAQIEREQEWARSEMIRRTRLARWKQEQDEIRVIETISGVIAVMFISMFFGWFMWQLRSWSTGY
jgi:ABC-type phosphate transport system auxiliary subunit